MEKARAMSEQLSPFNLTGRSVHLCIDMQRVFSSEGPWPTSWMDRVLPVTAALAGRHPERTVFTRFIPPERAEQMPGMWQRYYTRWHAATRECQGGGQSNTKLLIEGLRKAGLPE
jgi:nicotinamidase-related amidase